MNNRRHFLKATALGFLPAVIPGTSLIAETLNNEKFTQPTVRLYGDSDQIEPGEYLERLRKINADLSIKPDMYGDGGTIADLENRLAAITGKEKAIYMPTGTMANQLALAVLSGDKTKVFVQDTSHVYRDEGDAAQSVFQKRLMPLAKDQTYFTLEQLQTAIGNLDSEEVFKSGIGAISIENPVRRTDGRIVPISEIQKISNYCRQNNIRLHLDGARIFIAAAWSGVSIKEYASYFDTIYISLYKYLGASGGAVLCGDKSVIEKMPHLMKIHGGTIFQNWSNAAMALNGLQSIEQRFQDARARANEIIASVNKLPGISITPMEGGSNIYLLQLGEKINGKKFRDMLFDNYKILMRQPDKNNQIKISINETVLYQSADYIVDAFAKCR